MTRLATVKEACAYGKMSRTVLYEKMGTKDIVAYKRGRRTLVDLDSVDAVNARELAAWAPEKAGGLLGAFPKRPKA